MILPPMPLEMAGTNCGTKEIDGGIDRGIWDVGGGMDGSIGGGRSENPIDVRL